MAALWFWKMHMMHLNRKPHLLKIEYARSSRSQCKWLLGCDKIAEGDLRIGVVHDTWPWTQWFHFDCFWGDDFEEFYKNNRGKVIGVAIEDLMEGYRSISEDDQKRAVESLEEWIDICKTFHGGDEDYGNSVAIGVDNQAGTSQNNENGNNKNKENLPNNQNGNKTPGNDNNGNVILNKENLPNNQNGNKTPGTDKNGNVKNKENVPKVQNGNKTSGKKVLITKRVAETSTVNQGLKRAIDPVPKIPEKKIRILNSFVGFL
ncbi:uncharacterized protein DDB_G0288805-like [Mytilus trossulus]|uniref:uncharacterized protein DDB_G0288805-like n=1 Tax=Mytilus trossulus TaxID=6551 RepID=UPI0030068B38